MPSDNNAHIFIYWDDEPTNFKTTKPKMEKSDSFADFVDELTNSPANANACSIDNDDCEACGS
ncbi:MAG: hypothetical protein ACN4EF_02290 [Wenyingzhuangia sp.]|uniref:hypothetical protein n=1 Tax=Wenyingzhuangia sp. TaxID=1964193 RepID=UPI003219FC98